MECLTIAEEFEHTQERIVTFTEEDVGVAYQATHHVRYKPHPTLERAWDVFVHVDMEYRPYHSMAMAATVMLPNDSREGMPVAWLLNAETDAKAAPDRKALEWVETCLRAVLRMVTHVNGVRWDFRYANTDDATEVAMQRISRLAKAAGSHYKMDFVLMESSWAAIGHARAQLLERSK